MDQKTIIMCQVDGDSDGGQVNKELRRCIHKEINALRRERALEDMNEHGKKERGKCKVHILELLHNTFQFLLTILRKSFTLQHYMSSMAWPIACLLTCALRRN